MAHLHLTDDPIDGVFWESVMNDPDLSGAISSLTTALTNPPSEALRSIQIAAAADAAMASPPVPAAPPIIISSPQSFWARRTAVVSSLATGLFFKVAVGAMAMTTAVGGVAAASGVLPDPIQAAASDTLEFIGLEIPHPDDAPDTAPGQTGNSPSDTAPGQTGNSPSDTAPGQTGDSPSDTAPGQTGDSPSDTAPGQSGGTGGNGNGNGNGGGNGNG